MSEANWRVLKQTPESSPVAAAVGLVSGLPVGACCAGLVSGLPVGACCAGMVSGLRVRRKSGLASPTSGWLRLHRLFPCALG
jgi:hypothetical protein